jgi:hypothetical protein
MKITQIEIECTAEELKASNTMADGVVNCLRGIFNNFGREAFEECAEEMEEEE